MLWRQDEGREWYAGLGAGTWVSWAYLTHCGVRHCCTAHRLKLTQDVMSYLTWYGTSVAAALRPAAALLAGMQVRSLYRVWVWMLWACVACVCSVYGRGYCRGRGRGLAHPRARGATV